MYLLIQGIREDPDLEVLTHLEKGAACAWVKRTGQGTADFLGSLHPNYAG